MNFKSLSVFIAVLCLSTAVYADNAYKLKEITPIVKAALDGRRSRFDLIEGIKRAGDAGENNRGYLTALKSESAVKSLVEKENADRKIIYNAILEQNGLQGAMEAIEKVFAKEQRERAETGDKIQNEDGSWQEK